MMATILLWVLGALSAPAAWAAPDDPMGRDAQAVARYLDGPSVAAALQACAPAQSCGPAGDALVAVALRILAEGRVAEATVQGLDDAEARCWQERLLACPMPKGDEASQRLRLSLPVHQGKGLDAQELVFEARPLYPVLLRLPPQLAPAPSAVLIDAIWPQQGPTGESTVEAVYTPGTPAPAVPGVPSEKAPDGP